MTCTFFGHSECYGLSREILKTAITELIQKGVDTFYVGNHGEFDRMVYGCLKQLQMEFPHISVSIVLAYLPGKKQNGEDLTDTMYPEIEGHPKFAIARRNQWMIHASNYCLCYIDHTWGGAYQFARIAKHRNLKVINLGQVVL